uniref:Anaphase-promoting complex subunit 1 n=1 Tax=Caenorhabditis japonica TaxID=281687 RepID=A0A8R1DLW2_CAEJA
MRGGLERNIHTRGLARMANDEGPGTSNSPTQSYGRLQTTSSPYRTHLTHRFRRGYSNAELLRDFTRMIRDTPRNLTRNNTQGNGEHVDFGDLERDPDVDLLLSKVCFECVYVEPKHSAMPKANKVFISTFVGEMYLNLVSTSGEVMKIIPIYKNAEKTRRNLVEGAKHEPITIECLDAAFVMKSGITIVIGADHTTQMYGGNKKIAPIFIPEISNKRQSRNYRLFQFANNRVAAINEMHMIVLEIPKTVICESTNQIMKTCFLNFEREFARKLLIKWRSVKRDVDLDRLDLEQRELADVVMFMLENVGVRLINVSEPERAPTPEERGGKQMRPRVSEAEVTEMMKDFFQEMAFRQKADFPLVHEDRRQTVFTVDFDSTGEGSQHARDLFNALHSQCEEWTGNTLVRILLMKLVPYTYILAKILNYRDYEKYYLDMFGSFLEQVTIEFKCTEEGYNKYLETVPPPTTFWSFYDIIAHLIDERTTSGDIQKMPTEVTKNCAQLLTILASGRDLLHNDMDLQMWIGKDWAQRLGLSRESLKSFRTILRDTRSNAPCRAANLMKLFKIEVDQSDYLIIAPKILCMKYQTDAFAGMTSIVPTRCVHPNMEEMRSITGMRWKHDIRKRNVQMMLDSSRPILIATNILRKSEEENMKELQDRFLTQTSFRTFSQPFGRGFFEFRTALPSLLTSLHIPRLCVGGMVYPARVTCDPPTTDLFKLCTEWGNFYNAVAAALRLGSSDTVLIDNEWIVMASKNIKSTAVVGGMTLGLGLNGHLANFNMYHAHQMLSTFDKFNSVALLIGLSASKFKTCDNQIHKILATYLSFLMGPTPLEIKLDFTIQTAAVCGLGLLFADSGNMNIAKKLVNEIGKAPNKEDEPVTDRAAYKLCAGFALGLIMLGKGNGAASAVIPFKQNIPPLSKRLIYMMKGMRRDQCVFLPQPAAPIVNEVTNLPFSNGGLMSSNQVANHVKEGDNVNIHQSAEPATIALGLMFMKTHNKFIAESLSLPSTITELERLRPDTIYSRVLGQCLVMWNDIKPTQEFVKNLIPQVIQDYATAALHFGIPVRRDEDGEEIHEALDDNEEKYWADIVDRVTIAQTFLYTISAACMAIALKYSSCGGPKEHNVVNAAFRVIEYYTKIVLPDGKSTKDMGSVRMCFHAGAYTRSSCLSMLITAMSILRVGTADLEVMRYARLLRLCDKPESDWIAMGKKHFEQMVSHQALGILLMGEGRYAFKKDDISIALTIISTFPTIPQSVSDNSHYHQPLRFLWSLAVEPRLLVPYDCGESCVVEVDVTITLKKKDKNKQQIVYKQTAPSLLPPLEDLHSISVGGGKYEMVHIKLQTEEELKVMKDVMSVGHGRIMIKKFKVNTANEKLAQATSLYERPLNLMEMLQNPRTSYGIDEVEVKEMIEKLDEQINLNSSDQYPNVQVQLSTVRDTTERTLIDLAQLERKSLRLLGDSLDLWTDEVNAANGIHALADNLQSIRI